MGIDIIESRSLMKRLIFLSCLGLIKGGAVSGAKSGGHEEITIKR